MRILIIEDDPLLGDGLQAGLRHLGFTPDWVRDGVAARNALSTEEYGALVLDLGLPRLSGLDLLRQVRSGGNTVPVLILTARDALQDKLAGLDAGADDYLVKPVDVQELAARLRALIRRSGGRAAPLLCCGEVELDPAARRVRLRGEPVEISAKELAILEALMTNAGRVMSRGQLEAALYGWGEGAESNAVEVFIHHLRRKLGHGFIRTLRGIGYMVEKEK
ncbi:MAG TPA: response regulator [Burkholderiales bacterium]